MLGNGTDQRPGLRGRILQAAGWMLAAHGAELAIRLTSNLIMTRLLFPEAFGLMAVVISINVGLSLVTDTGINASIIRSKSGEDKEYLRSAWTLQVIRGLALWLIMLALAAGLSLGADKGWLPEQSTLADPLMPALLAVVGLTAVLSGLGSVNLHVNARRIDFKRPILIGVGSGLVALPVMLLWALIDRSVWALMAGMMAGVLVRLVLSHAIIPGPRMGFRWHRPHVHELFNFGKWITVSSAASFVSSHSDRLILGILFPGSVLGLYAIARLLADAFQGVLERLHGALSLPVLAEVLREKPETLRDKYYRFRLPLDASIFLGAGALMVGGPELVEVLYDDRYREAGWMLQILALSLITAPFQVIGSVFVATGETRLVAIVSILQGISLVVVLSFGYFLFGLQGAIFGVAVSKVPGLMTILVLANRRGWISPWREVRCLPLIAFGAISAHTALWIMGH